jgi:hypothetical protein
MLTFFHFYLICIDGDAGLWALNLTAESLLN